MKKRLLEFIWKHILPNTMKVKIMQKQLDIVRIARASGQTDGTPKKVQRFAFNEVLPYLNEHGLAATEEYFAPKQVCVQP